MSYYSKSDLTPNTIHHQVVSVAHLVVMVLDDVNLGIKVMNSFAHSQTIVQHVTIYSGDIDVFIMASTRYLKHV